MNPLRSAVWAICLILALSLSATAQTSQPDGEGLPAAIVTVPANAIKTATTATAAATRIAVSAVGTAGRATGSFSKDSALCAARKSKRAGRWLLSQFGEH